MAAPTKTPNNGLTSDPPVRKLNWTQSAGEQETWEWPIGTPTEILEKYEDMKAEAGIGSNLQQLNASFSLGRSSLMARFARTSAGEEDGDDSILTIEELYAVDVVRDIREAPYFTKAVDEDNDPSGWGDRTAKGLPLSDDKVVFVKVCAEHNWTQGEIDEYVDENPKLASATYYYANWDDGMKELHYHLLHGVDSYYETAFVLRRSKQGVRTSTIKASFDDINYVVSAPTFETEMSSLIKSLPSGEWLKKPPQAEYLGKGLWRIDEEWHWASQWSIVYAGTWNI